MSHPEATARAKASRWHGLEARCTEEGNESLVLDLGTVEEDEVMKVMRGISVSKCRSLRAFCRGK